jgi:site-specific recombinase XerD
MPPTERELGGRRWRAREQSAAASEDAGDREEADDGRSRRREFADRRDAAILRLFLDTGVRVSEAAGIMLPGDLDPDDQVVVVVGKGRRPRAVSFGRKTALALDRYLRMRAGHPFAHLPNLWFGMAGVMTPSGLNQVVVARGAAAGLPRLHPHQFRHSFADSWLSAGGNEGDLMRLAG